MTTETRREIVRALLAQPSPQAPPDWVATIIGPPGPDGPPGETGPEGARGLTGETGRPGTDGADGAPGIDGVPGSDGQPGPEGPRGKDGKRGPKGEKGEKGEPGQDGRDGGFAGGRSYNVRGFASGMVIDDEGTKVNGGAVVGEIDYAGAGVSVAMSGGKAVVTIPGGGGSGLPAGGTVGQVVTNTAPGAGDWETPATLTVSDEGTPLDTAVSSLDFTGAGVTASVVGHAVTVDVAGSDVIVQAGPPTQGFNQSWAIDGSPTTGTFTLSDGVTTTAPIAYGATGATIAAAAETVWGAGNVEATDTAATLPSIGEVVLRFIGDYGAQPVAAPILADSTDGSLSVNEDFPGALPSPLGVNGQTLIDSTEPAAYQWGPALDDGPNATVWHRVWVPDRLRRVDGDNIKTVTLGNAQITTRLTTPTGVDQDNVAELVIDPSAVRMQVVDPDEPDRGTSWVETNVESVTLYLETINNGERGRIRLDALNGLELRVAAGLNFLMPTLRTTDPALAGALWNNLGVLMVSAG